MTVVTELARSNSAVHPNGSSDESNNNRASAQERAENNNSHSDHGNGHHNSSSHSSRRQDGNRQERRRRERTQQRHGDSSGNIGNSSDSPRWWKLWTFATVLVLDATTSIVLLTPFISRVSDLENLTPTHYSMHGTLWDLSVLAFPRILSALMAIMVAYHRLEAPPESPFELYRENGERKSKADLEAEALEEPWVPMIKRYVGRIPFACEFFALLTGILLTAKSMARLNVEIGVYDEALPKHPIFWIALCLTAIFVMVESTYVDSVERLATALGQRRRQNLNENRQSAQNLLERISESLTQPLLAHVNSDVDLLSTGPGAAQSTASVDDENDDEEQQQQSLASKMSDDASTQQTNQRVNGHSSSNGINRPAVSDIGADANYSATWSDLLALCKPDKYLILLATIFLLAAAVANVYVPRFTGEILDALVANPSDDKNSYHHHKNQTITFMYITQQDEGSKSGADSGSIAHIPGFIRNIELLVMVSILGGVFAGIRGAIFTMVGARVNCRLRIKLTDSILSQEIGFFDTTRTGDLTSRLSSDTTIVGNAIITNVNIFLRSTVRAIGVLIFMFTISWQLSLLAFLTIPAVSVLSKWYGRYIRRLSKLQQKKLADGNSVSQSSISSMSTVRAFGAELIELAEFEQCMQNYLTLNARSAIATLGYTTVVGALPQLVKAVVLFYGGLLVQTDGPDHISGGNLVSFILYLSSLSEAFNNLGGIYASLVRAVGAADKVFELMNRQPRMTAPSHVDEEKMRQAIATKHERLLGVESTNVVEQRAMGLYPATCAGQISFRNVHFRYPARPHRVVLNGLDLTIEAGSIVALVGVSGSGKSSIVKLIQHLYEPTSGEVLIDGTNVQELSADWLCRNVSVVSQEPTLFGRSVKRNIIYGLEGTADEPTQAEIEEAALLANAAGFIEALPQGYDTEVGERGIQLSGGQKQRIAIARALVRRPRILLLDEATSALDSESEFVVQQAIDDMISGQRSLDGDPSRSMTVVIVAHRLSTVRNADCIFVIQNGQVVECGNHGELASKEAGVYSGLIRRQLGPTNSM